MFFYIFFFECVCRTFILTTEPIMEPPKKLKEALEELGISKDSFICTDIGETKLY